MKSVKHTGDVIVLDDNYSTTRRLIVNSQLSSDYLGKTSSMSQVSPSHKERIYEGGLRLRGFTKRGELDKPLISVVTVVRNGSDCLERAIQSVLGQAYDNIEYIVIDGRSTDGTLEIIKKYDEALDYWLSESDEGVYDAMNKALKLIHGDYILFLGSDDVLFNVIHVVVRLLHDASISYYGNVLLKNNKKKYCGKFHTLKLLVKNIPHQAIFYSRYVFDSYRFNAKYASVADYEMNLKIFSNKSYGFRYVPYSIAKYNNETGISSTVVDYNFSKDKPEIIRKNYPAIYYWIYFFFRFVFRR
jgi:glycosyltransferase involved in cell wall biosynthesis